MTTSIENQIRELDHRAGDGVDVRLLWSPESNRIVLRVIDWRSEEEFELAVPPADALDAFRHPFAYIGRDEPAYPLAA
jgi:hypothetical protein